MKENKPTEEDPGPPLSHSATGSVAGALALSTKTKKSSVPGVAGKNPLKKQGIIIHCCGEEPIWIDLYTLKSGMALRPGRLVISKSLGTGVDKTHMPRVKGAKSNFVKGIF